MQSDSKQYPREFKLQVVQLITDGGASAPQVAKDMDIELETLYRWIKELSAKQEEVFPGKGNLTSDAEIIRKLKRENERLKAENEMLQKIRDSISEDPAE
jgi:transposase